MEENGKKPDQTANGSGNIGWKRGRGRPKGKHGPYFPAHMVRQKIMIRLPQWMIDQIREMSAKERESAGKLIEKALVLTYGMKKSEAIQNPVGLKAEP